MALRTFGCDFKRPFDFRQLDAVTAQLHLVIATADEFDDAVRPTPRQIARPIDALAIAEGIRQESFRGQAGTAKIASRQPNAADEQFAGHVRAAPVRDSRRE